MEYDLDKIASAIKELSIETGKNEVVITSALGDCGIVSFEQEMLLVELLTTKG
jgi:hypothetical protein